MSRFVVGPRAVAEAVRARSATRVMVAGDRHRAIVDEARKCGVDVDPVDRARIERVANGANHQDIAAEVFELEESTLDAMCDAHASPLLVALDEITDPHNFGAIVRSAVAFGADGVITLRHRAAPITPAVVRASAGAMEHARITTVTNLAQTITKLVDRGLEVIGLDADATDDIHGVPFPRGGRVLVVGSEGRGLRRLVRERCTGLAKITMHGTIASLNASVAAAIALDASARARALSGK